MMVGPRGLLTAVFAGLAQFRFNEIGSETKGLAVGLFLPTHALLEDLLLTAFSWLFWYFSSETFSKSSVACHRKNNTFSSWRRNLCQWLRPQSHFCRSKNRYKQEEEVHKTHSFLIQLEVYFELIFHLHKYLSKNPCLTLSISSSHFS